MFENLTNKLGNVFNALKKRGALTEKDVDEALKDVRVCLLYTSPSPRDKTVSRMPSSA